MAIYIKSAECPEVTLPDNRGSAREIMNRVLCGAETGVATIRTLSAGQATDLDPLPTSKQLVYIIEGAATVSLNGTNYPVGPGAGLYLEENEGAALAQDGEPDLVALHLVVPPAAD